MRKWVTGLLALLCIWVGNALALGEETDTMVLTAVNVGKGDCLLLQSGEDIYLIDTAKVEHWGDVSASLRERNITHLSGVIVTHADKDHAGGVMALASSSIAVDGWYTSPYCVKYKESKNPVVLAAAMRGEQVTYLRPGDALPLGNGTLTVIGPIEPSDTENNNSLVMLAKSGTSSILLTGDMEYPEEDSLLAANVIPQATVIKIANHGENDATSVDLLQAVRPKLAVITTSVWEEPDTPANRVLKAILSVGAKYVITQDAKAAIEVTVAGGEASYAYVGHAPWPEKTAGVVISAKDNGRDTITLTNQGNTTADLSQWYITSEKGGEVFVLPEGTALASGASLTISSLSSEQAGDLVWLEKKVWNANKPDAAALYDAYGRQMSEMD